MQEQKNYDHIESVVRSVYGSVVWTHKIHEKQADIYEKKYKRIQFIKILTASITSAGIFSLFFSELMLVKIASVAVSFCSTFISLLFKSFDFLSMIEQHKAAAKNVLSIRDALRLLLLRIKLQKKSAMVLYDEFEEINNQLIKIYADAPRTTEKAVDVASIALNRDKESEFSDEEIDKFLPEKLRKNN